MEFNGLPQKPLGLAVRHIEKNDFSLDVDRYRLEPYSL
jgi:hypothetical protein